MWPTTLLFRSDGIGLGGIFRSAVQVTLKLVPASVPSLLDSRHLLHRRNRLPTRKYQRKCQSESENSKVPFFTHNESFNTPEENVFSITRENPRGPLSCPVEHMPSSAKEQVLLKDAHIPLHQNADESCDDDGHQKRTGNSLWTCIAHVITAVNGSGVLSLARSTTQSG